MSAVAASMRPWPPAAAGGATVDLEPLEPEFAAQEASQRHGSLEICLQRMNASAHAEAPQRQVDVEVQERLIAHMHAQRQLP